VILVKGGENVKNVNLDRFSDDELIKIIKKAIDLGGTISEQLLDILATRESKSAKSIAAYYNFKTLGNSPTQNYINSGNMPHEVNQLIKGYLGGKRRKSSKKRRTCIKLLIMKIQVH
jgi:hypothetical protein